VSTSFLFLSKSPPYPATIGGNQRTALIHRALSRYGKVEMILALDPADLPEAHVEILRRDYGVIDFSMPRPPGFMPGWCFVRKMRPALVDRLAQHLGSLKRLYDADGVLSETVQHHWTSGKYAVFVGQSILLMRQAGGDKLHPNILDVSDSEIDMRRSRLGSGTLSFFESLVATRHQFFMLKHGVGLLKDCDALWFVKRSDADDFRGLKGEILPNIPYLQPANNPSQLAIDASQSKVVFVVASFHHRPNVDGLDRFIDTCWPAIKKQVPTSILRVGGSGLPDPLRTKWQGVPGVELLGFVEDLDAEYVRCAFTIAPIYWGGGTNIKVIESLAHGRTAVISRFAQRGYEETLLHNEALWVAEDDQEMIEGCVALLNDSEKRVRLSQKGAAVVAEHYSFAEFEKVVRGTVERVCLKSMLGVDCQ
jgi:polysaccharide biosynthesis protein PslH